MQFICTKQHSNDYLIVITCFYFSCFLLFEGCLISIMTFFWALWDSLPPKWKTWSSKVFRDRKYLLTDNSLWFTVQGPQKGPTSWYLNCQAGHHSNFLHKTSSWDKSLLSKLANPCWTKRRLNVMRCMKRLPPGSCCLKDCLTTGGRFSSLFIFGLSGQGFFFLTLLKILFCFCVLEYRFWRIICYQNSLPER